jgi:Mg2+/Co2+ transporter CorB
MALALVVVVAEVFAAQAALVDPYALSIVAQVVVGNALRLVQPILIAYAAVRHQLLEANVRIR